MFYLARINLPIISRRKQSKKEWMWISSQSLLQKSPEYRGFRNVPGNVLLSHAGFPRSTIGAEGLNCRVRDGIGCFPYAIATGKKFWKLGQIHIQE